MNRTRTKPLPQRLLAVIALMECGFRDLDLIAHALGLGREQVDEIDAALDKTVRRFAVTGVPRDFTYLLRRTVRCPGCRHRINRVPCLTCRIAKQRVSEQGAGE